MPGFKIPINADPACSEQSLNIGLRNDLSLNPSHVVEVARAHRWVFRTLTPLDVSTGDPNILVYAFKCGRPTVEIDEIKIFRGQQEIYRPGKHRWMPIEMTFYDVYEGGDATKPESFYNAGVARKIYKWWSETTLDAYENNVGRASTVYQNGALTMLDGYGKSVWRYKLFDIWPTKISPSDLDYSSTNLAEIVVTMRYNKAEEVEGSAT